MSSFAVLCSGQGGQAPDLFERFPFADKGRSVKQQVLDSGCLSPEVIAWLENPKIRPDLIYQDHYAQPLLCLFQAMVWAELSDRLPTPQFVAGYSLGELSAYGCAGALAPKDVIDLASVRANLMDTAAPVGSLIATSGLAVEQAAEIAARHEGYVAIIIRNDHCLLGCLREKAEALASAAAMSARSVLILNVTVASHTPLLNSAVEPFREALRVHDCRPFKSPVLAGVNACKIQSKSDMVQWLPEQIHRTVRWDLISSCLAESNCHVALELGSGAQLAHLALAGNTAREARSISEFRTVDGIVSWVEKALNRTSQSAPF
jgi:[acyl-carrier-protein] S-malonyltransferase